MTDQEFNRLNRMSKKLGGKYRRGFLRAFADSLKRTLDDMLGDDIEEKLYITATLTTDLYLGKYYQEENEDNIDELEEVLSDEDAILSFTKTLFSEEDDEAVDDGEVVVKSFKVKKEDFADLVKGRKNGRSRKD